ncbi:type I-G CRISPR-associated protein Csb2 [Alicyclobacillus acidiphilus]|uniref:type I-G CRISPR-associated protein Csb2 n=1 Tax=Alicyclobacillus acidiphilus TaxID=182455 RepID=UPI00083564B6|nr:type I-U CRISPR-associated protein Csb2 [Alicyclobacillus acidiphilus]
MMLVLEIEYLSGVSYAAIGPDSAVPDWPPQPDRIFSALVATWAAHGEPEDEMEALKWLEQLEAPLLDASEAWSRTQRTSYVPPNDATSSKKAHALHLVPARRERQPRHFAAARPEHPILRLLWKEPRSMDEEKVAALNALAMDTAYVGHSSSLTRCRVYLSDEDMPDTVQTVKRTVYPGRLDELVRAFEAGRRPRAGVWVSTQPPVRSHSQVSVFSPEWLLLEAVEGEDPHEKLPDIRAAALAAKAIRDRIVEGYRLSRADVPAPAVVSGKMPNGRPAVEPHLSIVPLAFVGFPYADGHLLGFGLVPPRGSRLFNEAGWRGALRSITEWDERSQRHVMVVPLGSGETNTLTMKLAFTLEPSKKSLDSALYVYDKGKPARTFATVTPMVLDRYVNERGTAQVEAIVRQIVQACRHIGLPEPEMVSTRDGVRPAVIVDKHSSFEGAPSVTMGGKQPHWMRWRLPDYLSGRMLTHAVIRFPEPVAGPVILGAGRYLGLGLCRPVADGGDFV